MRYTNWDLVVARWPMAAKLGNAEATKIEQNFILDAEGEIDAALAARYAVPLTGTPTLAPAIVTGLATDLSYYKMGLHQFTEEQADRLWRSIERRLNGLAAGSLTLTNSAGIVSQAATTGAWSTKADYTNVSGLDPVDTWEVSSGELLAEQDRRQC